MTHAGTAEQLGAGALEWLLHTAQKTDDGLRWSNLPGGEYLDATYYRGTSGVVAALLEGYRHFGDDRYGEAALSGARWLASMVEGWEYPGVYVGLTGIAFTLKAVRDLLGDEEAGLAAGRAMERVRARLEGPEWEDDFDMMTGNGGIAMGALHFGDRELALRAAEPHLAGAIPTADGLTWRFLDSEWTYHHLSHGTLGNAYALITTGHALGREDLFQAGLAGVADVVARNEAGPEGFLVPHTDPQRRPERTARFNYGWCHGPAGDVHAFRLLAGITGDPAWSSLVDRCWHTITTSGLPQRSYPGFWDNNGRCCGTASVLAVANDRMVERGDGHDFGATLVADLAERAVTDGEGTRWSNHEHRDERPDLAPQIGWGHGSAGIVPELLRCARVMTGRDQAYAVRRMDQPEAVAA